MSGLRSTPRRLYQKVVSRLFPPDDDPTKLPPPSYTKERADAVVGEAYRRCMEYIWGTNVGGDILEFGTFRGYSARLFATLIQELRLPAHLYLFDSFEGWPEIEEGDRQSYEVAVNKSWARGYMCVAPEIPEKIRKALAPIISDSRLHIVKGFYCDTLDEHLPRTKAALVHLDCDLYSSTREVLDRLLAREQFADGWVIICDDYNCNRASPRMGERLAMVDSFGRQERFVYSPWFAYGWHGQAFFVHDNATVIEAQEREPEPVAAREAQP